MTDAAQRVTFNENAKYAEAQLKEAERAGNTLQRRQAARLARYWQAQVARLPHHVTSPTASITMSTAS